MFTFTEKDNFVKAFMEHLLYVSEIKDSAPVSEDHDCTLFFSKNFRLNKLCNVYINRCEYTQSVKSESRKHLQ